MKTPPLWLLLPAENQRGSVPKIMRKALWIILTVALAAIVTPCARADSVTFVTASGSTSGGQPVDASATFTMGSGVVTIILTDLQTNPTSVGQLISDLDFVLSSGATGTLASSSGQEIAVKPDGSFVLGAAVATGWAFNANLSGGLQLDVLGTPTGPSHLIIGPPGANSYTSANGSIAGNAPHNPFLNQTATFMLDVPGATDSTTVTSAIFSFGTTPGNDVPGTKTVPEPSSLTLLLASVYELARGN
jgi:hypothetical protein